MKRKNQLGLLFGMMLSVASIQPAMAIPTPVLADSTNITIDIVGPKAWRQVHGVRNCSYNAYFCTGGPSLYKPLRGSLNAVLDTYTGGFKVALRHINGTLTSRRGSLTIHDGHLTDIVSPGFAQGSFKYTLTNSYSNRSESGTFHFYNHPINRLTENGLRLWGNNWKGKYGDHFGNQWDGDEGGLYRSALGLDLKGKFRPATAPVPEPSTMFLLGSGLLALPFLRKKSQKA